MSNLTIYAPISATGGNIENVWGTKMRVKTIDPTDKDAVEQAKADGWHKSPQDVKDLIEGQALEKENAKLEAKLADGKRIDELEQQLSTALKEIAEFESKSPFAELEKADLQALLDKRSIDYNKRDTNATLIKLLDDSE